MRQHQHHNHQHQQNKPNRMQSHSQNHSYDRNNSKNRQGYEGNDKADGNRGYKGGDRGYKGGDGNGGFKKSGYKNRDGGNKGGYDNSRSKSNGKYDKKTKPIKKQFIKKSFQETQPAVPNKLPLKTKGNQVLPTIQNMLQIKKQDRQIKTAQLFKKVRPFLHSYIQKKQGSRVVQLMFKWGNANIKEQIYRDILKNWKEVIKSNYALHVVSKVSVQYEFQRLAEDAIILQNHKQGSMVLQNFINKHPNSPKTQQIYKKFQVMQRQSAQPVTPTAMQNQQKNKQKSFQSQQILHNLSIKSIQKQYYKNRISKLIIKLALPTMIENQRQKTVQFLAEKFLELLTDDQGVKLAIFIYNYFDSKQKKNIIKLIKGHIAEIINMSSISYIALIKVITQTDDTVSIGNKLIPELLDLLSQILTTPNSKVYNILISLLSPRNNNFNCLGKIQKTILYTHCKKPQQSRKKQIRQYVYPTLLQYLTDQQTIDNTCRNPNLSRLALGTIKSLQTDNSQTLKQFITKILKHFLTNLQNSKIPKSNKINLQNSLIIDPFGSKLLKNILIIQESYIDKYCDKFSEIFRNNLEGLLYSNGSFVVTVLIQKGRNQLIDEIRRLKLDMGKVKASEFYVERMKGKVKK